MCAYLFFGHCKAHVLWAALWQILKREVEKWMEGIFARRCEAGDNGLHENAGQVLS